MPDFPDDYYLTKETLRDSSSQLTKGLGDEEQFFCDFCSKGVKFQSEPTAGMYLADDTLLQTNPKSHFVHQERVLSPISTYCESCTTNNLMFPCEGLTEVRLLIDLDSHASAENIQFTDISPEDDGIPWNPTGLLQKVTGIPAQKFGETIPDLLWAPELVITFLLSISKEIDVREIVNWNGTYNKPSLMEAQEKYHKVAKQMGGEFDRQKFRSHVEDQ